MTDLPRAPRVLVAAGTDRGLVRTLNEDCLQLGPWVAQATGARLERQLLAGETCSVVDGMGGHPGGDLASRVAAHRLATGRLIASAAADVDQHVQELSDHVRHQGRLTEGHAWMGATIAGLCFTASSLIVFNVGDCSILRIRDGYAGELAVLDRGGAHHAVTQCLGGATRPTAVSAHAEVLPTDGPARLVLCSDGLTDVVAAARIAELAAPHRARMEVVDLLIEAATESGAPDNVSVIVADLDVDASGPGR